MRRLSLLVLAVLIALPLPASAQKRLAFVDPIDIAQLRTECVTNPNGYSYTDGASNTTLTLAQWYAAGADNVVADILNTTRQTITIYRSDVRPQEVVEAIALFANNGTTPQLTSTQTGAIASLHAAWLQGFFRLDSVRLLTKAGADNRVLTNLLAVLTNGSASETRLRALGSRTGTRAEQLFGCSTNNDPGCEFVSVSGFHVAQARNLP